MITETKRTNRSNRPLGRAVVVAVGQALGKVEPAQRLAQHQQDLRGAIGENHWSHLSKCVECGHVGCCDSSPRRHARARFYSSGHPVMRSAEPGELWRWCYIHQVVG
ncbi:UBP-type zinc finger domain-containing protein [Gordonia oryzae]|uniref:UBP-type zinc finger domain-containing protein n=1 Tax=Gordonia oryzae TaxID=2487349 RepID=UPI003CCC49BA